MIKTQVINEITEFINSDFYKVLNISQKEVSDSKALYIKRKDNDVEIGYGSKSSFFRGLSYLYEHKNETNFEVTFNRNFDTNGLMIDLSRNSVLTIESLKKFIRILASFGLNRLLLYIEDTYEIPGYPYFGYQRGRYTADDLKEIDAYGQQFGVEVMAAIQTLGHMEAALRWKCFNNVRDGRDTLCVDEEETYKLIETMIKTISENLTSRNIHIGMDEAFSMGHGRYFEKYGYHDSVEMFARHQSKVIAICKKYGLEPMAWSDMFFRLGEKDREYYTRKPLTEKAKKLVPNDIGLVYWDYYHNDIETYDDMIEAHQELPNKVIMAAGAWRWSGFTPHTETSVERNKLILKSCINHGVKDVLVTSWADDGAECSAFTCIASLATFSCFDFFGKANDEEINSLLEVIGETLERVYLMDLPDRPMKKIFYPPYNPSKYLFYQDILVGIFDLHQRPEYEKNYAEYVPILEKASKESKLIGCELATLARLCDVLSIKTGLGQRIRKAYENKDNKALIGISDIEIPDLLNKLDAFHETFERQWLNENRAIGFDVIDGRLGYLRNRILTAQKRIKQYLNKEISEIFELKEPILFYDSCDYEEICWNWWIQNVSTNKV